jgi:MoaA/NifB/PqqE/SkfB family radical SAM enzyme
LPVEALHVELLHDCPNACLACDHRALGAARLKPGVLRELFKKPEFRGLKLVSFSGGEPLLYPGLAAALEGAAKAFPAATLVLLTSLYDSDKTLGLLRRLSPAVMSRLHIGSSLDGAGPVHDAMRGRQGSFSRLQSALGAIKKEFPGLSVGLTFTATSRNAKSFHAAWAAARALGVGLAPQFLVENSSTAGLAPGLTARKALAAGLRRALREGGPALPEAPALRQALDFLAGGPSGPCGAGSTFLMLAPEGEFYLCPFLKDIRAPLRRPEALRPPAAGHRTRFCAQCFLRCVRTSL